MTQEIALKLNGLNTDPNPLGSVPQGSLVIADNVVIDKQDVIELRRGWDTYGDAITITGSEQLNSLYSFQSKLLVHYGSTLAYDSNNAGAWVNYSGAYNPPTGAFKIRSVQQNKNFYFTTNMGVQKISDYNGAIRLAGVTKALSSTWKLSTGSFFENNQQVAYRIVYGYTDSNGNLLLGAPSNQVIAINVSGSAKAVTLTCYIPDQVTTGYFIQVYRSGQSGGVDVTPNDEMALVLQRDLTSGEISSQLATVIDNIPDDQRGATLYTSPSQEGIDQSNFAPPLCVDACLFNSSVFYFNVKTKQTRLLTMLSTAKLIGTASTGIGYFTIAGTFTSGSPTVTGVASLTTNIVAGQLIVSGSGEFAANTTVLSVNVGAGTVTMSANSTVTGSHSVTACDYIQVGSYKFYGQSTLDVASNRFVVATGTDVVANIADTAQNFVNMFNLTTAADSLNLYAYYESEVDGLPGKISFVERTIGSVFTIKSSKGTGFFPDITSEVSSSADTYPHYAYCSKFQQPEAVPLLNYLAVGTADQDIIRAIALKDSIVVMKNDGFYRITGEDVQSFRVTLFDSTVKLTAPESAVAFNNQIYAYTNQGIVAINENGIAVVSRPIESTLLKLSSSNYPNFVRETFGISYESDRKYILNTVSLASDTAATQAYVFNSFTNSFVRWDGTWTHAIVNPVDNKLYFCSGDASSPYIYKERKNYDNFDYADVSIPVTIVSYSGKTVELDDTSKLSIKSSLSQSDFILAIIEEIIDSTHILVSQEVGWDLGAATVYTPINAHIEWAPLTGGNPGIIKQFQDIMVFFRQADFAMINITFKSNFVNTEYNVPLYPIRSGDYGAFGWNDLPWNGGPPLIQPIRTYLPLEIQRCAWVDISIQHREALTVFALCGFSVTFNNVSTRFK